MAIFTVAHTLHSDMDSFTPPSEFLEEEEEKEEVVAMMVSTTEDGDPSVTTIHQGMTSSLYVINESECLNSLG